MREGVEEGKEEGVREKEMEWSRREKKRVFVYR